MNNLTSDDGRQPTGLYADIERFMELDNQQLNFVLAAWCRYRAADGDLVELLVDHVQHLHDGSLRDMKESYYRAALEDHAWVKEYAHHVKAITLASCKYSTLNHPELVKEYLVMNEHITKKVLLEVLEDKTDDEQPKAKELLPEYESIKN